MQRKNIEKSLFIDEITGIENISKCLYDFSLKKFDKVCMLTIRNESTLKAFLSESKFNIYLTFYVFLLIIIFVDFCICVENAMSSFMAVTPNVSVMKNPLRRAFCRDIAGIAQNYFFSFGGTLCPQRGMLK
jgi:hypothetical protein